MEQKTEQNDDDGVGYSERITQSEDNDDYIGGGIDEDSEEEEVKSKKRKPRKTVKKN